MRHTLLALLGILAVVSPVAADWRSLKTDHFLVIGDATDRDLRDVALRLEQFRDVVGRMNPVVVRDDAPPVVVLVFRSVRAFEPFMPKTGGRTSQVAGYFQPGEGVNYIAMTTENSEDSMPTILHEFSHLLLRSISKDAPLWYQEGLAEYYSTFEVVDGGRRANIGKPIGDHVALLRDRRLPFARFFAVERNSPEYTKDTLDRAVLYAQAWAIVHHAFHAQSKERRGQLLTFVQRLANGDVTAKAFSESYGIDVAALEREVQNYVQRQIYGYISVGFDARLATRVSAPITRLSDAEADAWLGDLLVQQGRGQEAAARLDKALAADPNLALAHASLGILRLREKKPAEAQVHLERAVASGSTNELAHFAYAYGLLSGGAASEQQSTSAAIALERALSLRPGYTEAKMLLSYAYLSMKRPEAARDLLSPVVKADPSNHRAALRLAEALLQLSQFDSARALLGPVLARSTESDERDRARELLGAVVALQRRRDPPAAADAASTPSAGGGSAERPAGRLQPLFRPIRQNEQRTYGVLEAIECSSNQIVLVVRTSDGAVRAKATRFMDIEFIAYKQLANMQVSCGKQNPPHEIYLTWRPEGIDRAAVAVEILPEEFVP